MATRQAAGPATSSERHRLVDALRGFALWGILVVNIEFIVQSPDTGWADFTSGADIAGRWLIATVAQLKFYLLFSFLFGYGLSVQLRRAAERGGNLRPRYFRRMVGLLILGVLHGILFFPGDILFIYGVVGAIAFSMRRWSDRRLLQWAVGVYAAATVVWLALAGLTALEGDPGTTMTSPEQITAFTSGSFLDVVQQHAADWPETLVALAAIQGPAAFSLFIVGVVVGRGDLLSRPENHTRSLRRVLMIWGPIGLAGSALAASLQVANSEESTLGVLSFALQYGFAPTLAAAMVAALALGLGSRPPRWSRILESAGRMSLSVYLLESVVATTLAYGYGFGLFGEVAPWGGIGLSIAIWLGLSLFAMAWMAWARFGPFEWVLRSWTYLRLQPLRQ